jgi:glycosyltransferase involved in cell wall biosynthesis
MYVNVAYYRETHIHLESGIARVLPWLFDLVPVLRYLEPCLPRQMPYRMMRTLAPPLGEHRCMSYYEPSALPLEYAVSRHLVTAPGELVHMFQGDAHFNYTAWLRHLPRRRRGALVVTFHQPPERFEQIWGFRRKRARLSAIDQIVVTSTPSLEYFSDLVGENRVALVPLGANRRVFNPPSRNGAGREGELRCLMVGSHLRDSALLRGTIERVCSKNERASFTVVSSQDFLDRLGEPPRTAKLHGISDDELIAAYHAADLFLHPVKDAAANTALIEAMSCGLPTVASDVGGVRDYADNSCAELVKPGDPDAMADAILRLAADPDRRHRLGAGADARSRAIDWSQVADQLVQVYGRALARRA